MSSFLEDVDEGGPRPRRIHQSSGEREEGDRHMRGGSSDAHGPRAVPGPESRKEKTGVPNFLKRGSLKEGRRVADTIDRLYTHQADIPNTGKEASEDGWDQRKTG